MLIENANCSRAFLAGGTHVMSSQVSHQNTLRSRQKAPETGAICPTARYFLYLLWLCDNEFLK